MVKSNFLLIFVLTSLFTFVSAQIKISGKVIDNQTQKPVAYADLNLPNAGVFTTSNNDGSFYLESEENDSILEITAEGYDFLELQIENKINYEFNIELNPSQNLNENSTIELTEATISNKRKKYKNKKENPAYAIMRELWARKRKNGLRSVPHYEYKEYEKLEFDLNNVDSTLMKSRLFKDMEFIFEKIDTSDITGKAYLPAFLNESIYKVYGKNEPSRRERKDLIANKSSGFDDNEIVIQTLKNIYKEFDIY